MSMPLPVVVRPDGHIQIGGYFVVGFQRTLRVPDDGNAYPLPPGLGPFPPVDVQDVRDRVPASWSDHPGVILPLHASEAVWLSFEGPSWHPCAAKIGVGTVNAVTGGAWTDALRADPQDYLVCPNQPWLDGFKTEGDLVRQFVAIPLGRGDTVEAQVRGAESDNALRIRAFEPREGRFPDRAPVRRGIMDVVGYAAAPGSPMGLGAGGKIEQKIYPDKHGIDTWDPERQGGFDVYILDARDYEALTGRPAPPTPVDAETYAKYGFPWFELYDGRRPDLPVSDTLAGIQSVRDRERQRGEDRPDEHRPVTIDPQTVVKLGQNPAIPTPMQLRPATPPVPPE